MKQQLFLVAFSIALLFASQSQAAFIIQANGLAASNFSAGTGTGNSTTAGSGTLLAPGLTAGVASVFGGEPYTYTYTPLADGDNSFFSVGGVLNSNAGHLASGITAGGVGDYKVYLTYPQSSNQSGLPALYDIDVDGDTIADVSSSYDQNVTNVPAGLGIGLWELVGTITVTDVNQPITLTISAGTTPGFVGIRTAGVLFDQITAIPEPTSLALIGLGMTALLASRRRSA